MKGQLIKITFFWTTLFLLLDIKRHSYTNILCKYFLVFKVNNNITAPINPVDIVCIIPWHENYKQLTQLTLTCLNSKLKY